MKRIFKVSLFFFITVVCCISCLTPGQKVLDPDYEYTVTLSETPSVSFLILFDNMSCNPEITTSWGYSCLVVTKEKTILFDTGSYSGFLLNNMSTLNINPDVVDIIVISHSDMDHVGGLKGFLAVNNDVEVFILDNSYRTMIEKAGARYTEVAEFVEIAPGIFSTGQIGIEQSLIVELETGFAIVTGCAHPGIATIVKKANEIIPDKKALLVIGGFHESVFPDRCLETVNDLKSLGVEKIGPSHCTGETFFEVAKEHLGTDYISAGVGMLIRL